MEVVQAGYQPKGSTYPNIAVFGPKYYTNSGSWGLIPPCLGTWTLRVRTPNAYTETSRRQEAPENNTP